MSRGGLFPSKRSSDSRKVCQVLHWHKVLSPLRGRKRPTMVQVHTKLLKSCGNYQYELEPSFRYMVGKLGFFICPSPGALLPLLFIFYFPLSFLDLNHITNFIFMVFNLIHSALRMCLFCPVLPKRERTKLTASSVFFCFIGIETKDYRYYDPVAPFVYLFSFFKKGNLLSIPASYTAKKEDLVLLDPFYAMTLLLLVEPLMMLQNLIRHPLLN